MNELSWICAQCGERKAERPASEFQHLFCAGEACGLFSRICVKCGPIFEDMTPMNREAILKSDHDRMHNNRRRAK